LGVKYNKKVVELKSTIFPLFNGTIKADKIYKYKYVALKDGKVVEEEKLTRTYSKKTKKINEVYNRTNKKYDVPELPEPFKPMFKMGSKDFEPLPKNVIYNVYANCDKEIYSTLSNKPFLKGEEELNNKTANCTFSIITPKSVFQSTGSIHLVGWLSRHYKKLSWSFKLDNEYLGRKSFKLRAVPNEPTLIREKLAIELFNAVGVPTQEGAYAYFLSIKIHMVYIP